MSFDLTTAEILLSLRISDTTLRRLRQQGVLQAGIHYRAKGTGSKRPPLVWDAEAVYKALAEHSERELV